MQPPKARSAAWLTLLALVWVLIVFGSYVYLAVSAAWPRLTVFFWGR